MYKRNDHSRAESIEVEKSLCYSRKHANKLSKILLKWNWIYAYQGALRTFSGPRNQKVNEQKREPKGFKGVSPVADIWINTVSFPLHTSLQNQLNQSDLWKVLYHFKSIVLHIQSKRKRQDSGYLYRLKKKKSRWNWTEILYLVQDKHNHIHTHLFEQYVKLWYRFNIRFQTMHWIRAPSSGHKKFIKLY